MYPGGQQIAQISMSMTGVGFGLCLQSNGHCTKSSWASEGFIDEQRDQVIPVAFVRCLF